MRLSKPKLQAPQPPSAAPSYIAVADQEGASGPDLKAGQASRKLRPSKSWYETWPRKSTPSTQVARESILADPSSSNDGNALADLSRFELMGSSATWSLKSPNMGKNKDSDVMIAKKPDVGCDGTDAGDALKAPSAVDSESSKGPRVRQEGTRSELAMSGGWFGWLGLYGVPPQDGHSEGHAQIRSSSEQAPSEHSEASVPTGSDILTTVVDIVPGQTMSSQRSWFGLWEAANTPPPQNDHPPARTVADDIPGSDAPMSSSTGKQPSAGSSWGFWYTNSPEPSGPSGSSKGGRSAADENSGQLAVVGEASERCPESARIAVMKGSQNTSRDNQHATQKMRSKLKSREKAQTPTEEDKLKQQVAQPVQHKRAASVEACAPPNIIMPSVQNTFRCAENPTYLQQITRMILNNRARPVNHVFLTKQHPKIEKAVAIGIHGLLPSPMLQTIIGKPTTSSFFATHAADAIRKWTDSNGSEHCKIEKIELTSEGKISQRVSDLWEILFNWLPLLREADFIMLACHSQGVPVGLMLIAKLIESGIVKSKTRIGVCAMAGVSLGPFVDYKSSWFASAMNAEMTELFELGNAGSTVSKSYEASVQVALKHGVRITYCGSIDDQLVSMESSFFAPLSHPYIYRLVFIDGRIHAPDFIAHLVGFALKLRNLGVSDQGLLRELSTPVAGSLYRGEGHSRLYSDEKIYQNAVEFALGTTSVGDVPMNVQERKHVTDSNPFLLPWIMRGLLEEDLVKTELRAETAELLKQFDDWKPTSKTLQNVKYRLEAVRSKL